MAMASPASGVSSKAFTRGSQPEAAECVRGQSSKTLILVPKLLEHPAWPLGKLKCLCMERTGKTALPEAVLVLEKGSYLTLRAYTGQRVWNAPASFPEPQA